MFIVDRNKAVVVWYNQQSKIKIFDNKTYKTYENLLKQNKKFYNNKNFKENTKQTQLFIHMRRKKLRNYIYKQHNYI